MNSTLPTSVGRGPAVIENAPPGANETLPKNPIFCAPLPAGTPSSCFSMRIVPLVGGGLT